VGLLSRLHPLLPLLAGAAYPLGLSPYDLWPAIPLSAALLCWSLHRNSGMSAFLIGWLYGIGLFGVGASWVYVSINVHGRAAPSLAFFLTAVFCLGLALLSGFQGYLYRRFFSRGQWWAAILAFPALWVLFEWLRSWLLTGFPWLYAGYAALDTPLAGWAPVIGVYGLSLWFVALGSATVALVLAPIALRRTIATGLILFALIGAAGVVVGQIQWTQPLGEPLKAALYQPNIPQQQKWDRRFFRDIVARYEVVAAEWLPRTDILLWPESALPGFRKNLAGVLDPIDHRAREAGTALITGIPVRSPVGAHNSIIALGAGTGEYHKQKLVPFGEYVPLEEWLRGLIAFFDLPMSSFTPGPDVPPLLKVRDMNVAPFICYEVVYPDFVTRNARDAQLLITVSNDSWFGSSAGPIQHLQMARFRALETGRDMLRGTNNGVSAIVDFQGNLKAASDQFVATMLTGEVQPRQGDTPVMRTGSTPVLLLCALILLTFTRLRRY